MTTRYSDDHEWIRLDGDTATIGISTYAAEQLGDVVYVELPEVGKRVDKGAEAAVVESVKAASEVYAPVSGEVVEVNDALQEAPQTVNESPESDGWFIKLRVVDKAELEGLMSSEDYKAYLETL